MQYLRQQYWQLGGFANILSLQIKVSENKNCFHPCYNTPPKISCCIPSAVCLPCNPGVVMVAGVATTGGWQGHQYRGTLGLGKFFRAVFYFISILFIELFLRFKIAFYIFYFGKKDQRWLRNLHCRSIQGLGDFILFPIFSSFFLFLLLYLFFFF